jgi:hypothetical protein
MFECLETEERALVELCSKLSALKTRTIEFHQNYVENFESSKNLDEFQKFRIKYLNKIREVFIFLNF